MKDSICFKNTRSFVRFLSMLSCAGKWLLPDFRDDIPMTADEYLEFQEKLEKEELAFLDFDGLMHPTGKLLRMTQNITKARSSLKFVSDKGIQIYLLGPVDCLEIINKSDTWEIKRCSVSKILIFFREVLYHAGDGRLITVMQSGDIIRKRADILDGGENQANILTEHLLIFNGGQKNARDSHCYSALEREGM